MNLQPAARQLNANRAFRSTRLIATRIWQAIAPIARAESLMSHLDSPIMEHLEPRRLMAVTPNIIVGVPTPGSTNTIQLTTYTPTGTMVGFPIPVPAQPGTDGPIRGIAVDQNGAIQMYNGSNTPVLTTYQNGQFTDHTGSTSLNFGQPIGWSTQSVPYYGGLTIDGPFVIATDMLTGGATPNDTRGLIEIDTSATPYTFSEIEDDYLNNPNPGLDFINVAAGQDHQLYALTNTGTVREYNDAGQLLANTVTLPGTNQTSITADGLGNLYVGTTNNGLYKTDAKGNVLKHFALYNATDLQMSQSGYLLAVSGGNIAVFDQNLNVITSFQVADPTGADFATFATYQGTGTPTPTPTPTIPTPTPTTPTPTGPTPTPTPIIITPTPTPTPPVGTDVTPPQAQLVAANAVLGALPVYNFQVIYTDNFAIQTGSLSSNNVTVTAPDGTTIPAQLTADLNYGPIEQVATYQIAAPTVAGTYSVNLQPNQIQDSSGNITPGGTLGAFQINALQTPGGPLPDLTASVVSKLPFSVVPGQAGLLKVRVKNDGNVTANGKISVSLFSSTQTIIDASASLVRTPRKVRVHLRPGDSKVIRIPFTYPDYLAPGSYRLIADVNSTGSVVESSFSNNLAVTPTVVDISPAHIDLVTSFPTPVPGSPPVDLAPGATGTEQVTITNAGNITASGMLSIIISAVGGPSQTSTPLPAAFSRSVVLKPGIPQTFTLHFTVPDLGAGSYQFSVNADPANIFKDSNVPNNSATDPTPFNIQ